MSLIKDARFNPLPCRGTYFQLLDYSPVADESDVEFAKRMTIEHGVAAIPPSAFYHQKNDEQVLRFCFAKRDETMESAAALLCRI